MNRPSNPNPFYAVLAMVGIAFVVTALAYVVALLRSQAVGTMSGPASGNPLLAFLERRGESVILYEAGALAVAAILAMGLDRWRSRNSAQSPASTAEPVMPSRRSDT